MNLRQNSLFNNQTEQDICAKLIKNDFLDSSARDAYLDTFCVSEDGRGLCFKASSMLHDKHLAATDTDQKEFYLSLAMAVDQARGRGCRAAFRREFEEAKSVGFGI